MNLKNKKVLILSGPTHEYLDPVRFIGNASSGKMGKALAEEAVFQGLEIDFISGPVPKANLPDVDTTPSSHPGCSQANASRASRLHVEKVTSAQEMLAAAQEQFAEADIMIFAAAVADFQPLEKSAEKLPTAGTGLTLELKPTPDIAATLCAKKRTGQTAIGFALQTHDGEARARAKLTAKGLDGIVLNTPASLGADTGAFTWIDFHTLENWGVLTKADCARRILDRALR